MEILHSATLRASRESIFQLLTDYEGWAWRFPAIKSVRIIKQEPQFAEVMIERRNWPHRLLLTDRLWPPERIIRTDKINGVDYRAVITLQASPNGTTLMIEAEQKFPGILTLFAPFLEV